MIIDDMETEDTGAKPPTREEMERFGFPPPTEVYSTPWKSESLTDYLKRRQAERDKVGG